MAHPIASAVTQKRTSNSAEERLVNLEEATSDKAEEEMRSRRWIEDNEVNSGTDAVVFALSGNDS